MSIWQIVSQCSAPQVAFGVKALSAAVREYGGIDAEAGGLQPDKNHLIASLDDTLPADSYRIRVCAPENGTQEAWVLGADENALLYGCMDFAYEYLSQAVQSHTNGHPYFFRTLFGDEPLPAADYIKTPMIRHRGLWTWGKAVYDYRGYLENMARLKLNEVIFWNDFPPVNGRDIVDYAHSLGIKVIWGYAWGWDTTMVLDDSEQAAARIAEEYENGYAHLGGDGIYFQSFTETSRETLGGRLIAEAVVDFVNRISSRILEKHPGLLLQFGLHASSVKNRLGHIAELDPRVHIIWENCGDFPYHYIPGVISNPAETEDLTRKILSLRPGTVSGAVLKGMINLNWEKFRHQTGPELMGCADRETLEKRLHEIRPILHMMQADWMLHGKECRRIIELYAEQDSELYGLVEDAAFDLEIPLPTALLAAMLWDCKSPFDRILHDTAQRHDVRFS